MILFFRLRPPGCNILTMSWLFAVHADEVILTGLIIVSCVSFFASMKLPLWPFSSITYTTAATCSFVTIAASEGLSFPDNFARSRLIRSSVPHPRYFISLYSPPPPPSGVPTQGLLMSVLARNVPRALATGTCNSGMLATEAGTIGRAVGNSLLTIYMRRFTEPADILNVFSCTAIAALLFSLLAVSLVRSSEGQQSLQVCVFLTSRR